MDDSALPLSMGLLASSSSGRHGSAGLRERVGECFIDLRAPMYRYLCSCGAHPAIAEEIVQESFLRLYRHLHGGNQVADLRSWVFHAAHNLLIDEIRKGKVRHTEPATATIQEDLQRDPALDPEQRLLLKERVERIRQGIAALTDLQFHSLHLRAEGLRYVEIAAILDVSVSTVADAVRRAVRNLGSAARQEKQND